MTGFNIVQQPQMRRTLRNPAHTFNLRTVPFTIMPFMIAPVLPGETMKNFLFQSRVVTDPIKNPHIGWWKEYYWYYCKLSDLAERDSARALLLNPAATTTTLTTAHGGTSAVRAANYAGGANQINWVELCRRACINAHFRDEGEVYSDRTITDSIAQPVAQIVGNNVLDSAFLEDVVTAVDVPVVDGADANATLDASEVDLAMKQWQISKLYGLTEMTWEDYLTANGLAQPAADVNVPELLRYSRNWSYPSNTIDPTNGTPRSAVSWTVSERGDKDRRFTEPGFIIGLTITRPKVYLRNYDGTASSSFNDYRAWLPSFLGANDPNISRKLLAHDAGPLTTIVTDTNGYWLDLKDLLMYGEQFVNYALSSTDNNLVPLPNAGLTNKRYVALLADVQELFVTGASAYYVREDGVCNLSIASSPHNPLTDTSPRGSATLLA